jgi:hypothetical protein
MEYLNQLAIESLNQTLRAVAMAYTNVVESQPLPNSSERLLRRLRTPHFALELLDITLWQAPLVKLMPLNAQFKGIWPNMA